MSEASPAPLPASGASRFSQRLGTADGLTWAFVVLLAVALGIVLVQNLTTLSLWMDEGFHYLAVQGIRAHGVPIFPSGHMYWKAILYTYALTLLSLVFGLNHFSLRILSVLAAAGCIPVLYALAKKLFNRWVGLGAVILFALSPWVAEDGRVALYYAPVLLFVLLGLYLFYRGFFEENRKAKVWATVIFLLTPLVHQLGMAVWFAFPAFLLVKGLKRFLKKDVLLSIGLVTVFYGLIQIQEFFFWKVGYVYAKTDTSLKGMITYFFSGFSLDYFWEFYRSFPLMSVIIAAGVFFALGMRLAAAKEPAGEGRVDPDNWTFLNLCLLFPLLFLGFFRTHVQPRYLFELYGTFVLLFTVSAFTLSRGLVDLFVRPFVRGLGGKVRTIVVLIVFAGLLGGLTENIGWGRVSAVAHRKYGDRIATDIINRAGRPHQEDHETTGLYVRHFLKPNDIVIAIHVVFGYIYAGRADYWLWSGGPGTWDAWEKTPTGWRDFYVGARWLNNEPDLEKVIKDNPGRRVWLIASNSLYRRDHINDAIHDFVLANSDKLVFRGKDEQASVYLWNEEPPRLTAGSHTFEGEWLPVSKAPVAYRDDLSKECGLELKPGAGRRETFSCDLGRTWPAGRYRLTLRAASAEPPSTAETALVLNLVTDKGAKVRSVSIGPSLFASPGRLQDISVEFVLAGESRLLLKGLITGRAGILLDAGDITPLAE